MCGEAMARKHWISVCQNEHKNAITETEQIFWESSSSDDEYFTCREENEHKVSSSSFGSSSENICYKNSSYSNALPQMNTPKQSPVIKLRCFTEISPELSQRISSIRDTIPSPVLEKGRLKMRKREKLKEILFNNLEKSPDMFCSEHSTQNIEYTSPVVNMINTQATMKIEPFPSQYGSPVEEENVKQPELLYYEPPKRRKTYKKGGLAYQLQNILKRKKSRIKIWHHEKHKNVDNILDNPDDIVQFKHKRSWTEYGVTLLECNSIPKTKTSFNEYEDKPEIFLVNLGVSQILEIELKDDSIYELYPPYGVGKVNYKGRDVLYYYNASKLVKLTPLN